MAGSARSSAIKENSLEKYLKDIRNKKSLSKKEELELAVRIRKGDKGALDKLIGANLRFVVSVAQNYQNQGLPLADLINEGNLGLIKAAKRFDETKNFKFISYAVWWIRQSILQALAEQSRIVKLPLNRVGTIHKVGRTSNKLEQNFGRKPSVKEIAGELKIAEKEVAETMRIGNSHMSLDAPVKEGEKSKLADLIKDSNTISPDESSKSDSLKKAIDRTLSTLTTKEKQVLKLYYGIDTDFEHTLEEIGRKLNLTRERVRQIKEKALKRLKHASRSKSLRVFKP